MASSLEELLSQAKKAASTTSATNTTASALHVHLHSHLSGAVNSRLLVTRLEKKRGQYNASSTHEHFKEQVTHHASTTRLLLIPQL